MKPFEELKIAVIGLGYVGLPLAVEFGRRRYTLGFDINAERVNELIGGKDHTLELEQEDLAASTHLTFSSHPDKLADCDVYIITVPTPIDDSKRPDLSPLISASALVGKYIQPENLVIYESTVYPGCTEEVCIPVVEQQSGLTFNVDFYAGYSPERINPGDKERKLTNILKVTSGSTPEAAQFVLSLIHI